jgi:hypothetical protein
MPFKFKYKKSKDKNKEKKNKTLKFQVNKMRPISNNNNIKKCLMKDKKEKNKLNLETTYFIK